MIEYFIQQKQWEEFSGTFKDRKVGGSVWADEAIWPYIMAGFKRIDNAPLLVVTSTRERALQLQREIGCLEEKSVISVFTGTGSGIFLAGRTADHESTATRLDTLKKLMGGSAEDLIVIATASSLTNLTPLSRIKDISMLEIARGAEHDREKIIGWLVENGYERVSQVYDRGEFSVRGDSVTVFDITSYKLMRIDLFLDEVEKISVLDPESRRETGNLETVSIFPNVNPWEIDTGEGMDSGTVMADLFCIIEELKGDFTAFLCDPVEVFLKLKSDTDLLQRIFEREEKDLVLNDRDILSRYIIDPESVEKSSLGRRIFLSSLKKAEGLSGGFSFSNITRQKSSRGNADIFTDNIRSDLKKKKDIIICTDSRSRIKKIKDILLDSSVSYSSLKGTALKKGVVHICGRKLYRGFAGTDLSCYGELDIYEQMEGVSHKADIFEDPELKPGEYVVHKTHGIGIYTGTISRQVGGHKREYFLIQYGKGDRLYVPTWNADRISRFIGSKKPVVTPLDSRYWDLQKKRVRKSVKELAVDLARLYAERQSASGYAFPSDSTWQKEMEDAFPFRETEDQVKAIEYVKKAMESPGPMDVLVIGDVGFGKTEVALRAAFKAIENGKQVLMLVPTTILADQHYMTFSKRFKDYPVIVEVLSRFRKPKDKDRVVSDFSLGKVDMLIGTHRVLQKDIIPRDLGLIIVDEEQRFGVGSKEKIKLLKKQVDVLTLTATPIPRTLYMSMAGVRDMALIGTYPEGRSPIETFVGETDYSIAANAVEREIARGGQVYYVYNRISGISQKARQLSGIIPEARIAVTHGRMNGQEIEKVMRGFLEAKYDILLTTSIIESGMDIENVNTLIVEDSHRFGLSQLYQLRGRVGRSSQQAYAYLFYPGRRNLSETAYQRLRALSEYTDLGSGYNIAMKDLEIRGAGEILGPRQHGHINSVGYDMYCQIMKEEVDRLKGIEIRQDMDIHIDLPVTAYIPKNYINSAGYRMNIYKKLGASENLETIDDAVKDMEDRYGRPPGAVRNLIGLSRIKTLMGNAGIESMKYSRGRGIIVKKVILDGSRADKVLSGGHITYQPRYGQVTIKNADKNIDLNIVMKKLHDIIKSM